MFYIDQYPDGLPDDFFDDVIPEVVAQEKGVIYVPGAMIDTDNGPIASNGVFVLDPISKELCTGRKYPVPPTYTVRSDLVPAETVLDWVIGFYSGDDRKFPHVPKHTPFIPPSRYEKTHEFFDVYSYFVNKGYLILNPTRGQISKFDSNLFAYKTKEDGKYIVNTLKEFNECLGNAIMLDFNPYNPISIMSVQQVEVKNSRFIKYRRVWKDNEVFGTFDKKQKRYHYDSWGSAVLGKNYYAAVRMRCFDLIVKHYSVFEKDVPGMKDPQNFVRPVLFDPIHVDPYYVNKGFWHPLRSNLRRSIMYREDIDYSRVCLPWNNYDLHREQIGVPFTKITQRDYKYEGMNIHLPSLHSKVLEYSKLSKAERTPDMEKLIRLSKDIFIQRKFVSVYDGSVVKRDEYCSQKYICAFVYHPLGEVAMTFVPYKVSRYPCNLEGCLLPDLMVLTLEEFMKTWQEIYETVKSPWWLEESLDRSENDKYDPEEAI
jgi:hypothetical protein